MSLSLTRQLMYKPPGDWTAHELRQLSAQELRALAELLGVPYSGTKEVLVERLYSLAQLRGILGDFGDEPEPLVEAYGKRELKSMAATAKIWKSGSKRQLAIGLIQWRNECRRKGRMAFDRAKQDVKAKKESEPQRRLPF